MRRSLIALVLAAGEGTRFKSALPKVLHPLLGKPMIRLVTDSIRQLKPKRICLVVGHKKEQVTAEFAGEDIAFVRQARQLGTAHAVLSAKAILAAHKEADVLIINGDLPLLRPSTLKPLLESHRRRGNDLTFMSAEIEDPSGFGRLVRDGGGAVRIVEEKDATPGERGIREINAGVYVFKVRALLEALPLIKNDNVKGEYYLTDIVEIMGGKKKRIGLHKTPRASEVVGVNTRFELSRAVAALRERKARELAESGVTIHDPRSAWIDLDVEIGRDTVLYPLVVIEGRTRIGGGCRVYPNVHILNSRIGDGVDILSSSVVEECEIENGVRVGPFSRLRPKTVLKAGSKVGNFVEMKNTVFGSRSKALHLSYLGDSVVGEDVNIGAGTITCNYDGIRKNPTHIEDGAFIGSGTELVAPVRVGRKAYVAAGSTITEDVGSEALAIARARQVEKPGWVRKRPKKA